MDKIRYTVLISHPSDVDEKTLDFIYQCFDMWNEQNQALPFEFYPFEWDKDVATLSEVANGQDVIDSVAEAYCDAVLAVFIILRERVINVLESMLASVAVIPAT